MHQPCSVDELVCIRTRWLAPSTRPWQNKARTTADERPYGLQRRCYNAVAFASISADNHSTTLPARQVALHLAARFATHTFSRLEQGSGSRQRRVRGRRCHATARFLHHTRSRMRSCVTLRCVALRCVALRYVTLFLKQPHNSWPHGHHQRRGIVPQVMSDTGIRRTDAHFGAS